MEPIIVVGTGTFHDPAAIAEHFRGQAAVLYEEIATPAQVAAATRRADALIVGLHPLDDARIAAIADDVRVIGRTGVGIDTIDLDAAHQHGFTVYHEPTYGAVEVASHALALILALQRKLAYADRFVRDGWTRRIDLSPMLPLDELTVGVVGCGRIGRVAVRQLTALAGTVLVHDPLVDDVPAPAIRVETLDALLARSDALTLHVPLSEATRGLIGRRELALLPRGAIVVNVARGGVIDEAALVDALESGHLGGAGLDVFEVEPLPPDAPILAAPNTLLTPHCAAYSRRAAWRLGTWTVADAIAWLASGNVVHGSVVVHGRR